MEKLNYQPFVRKILADTVTPVSIYLRLRTLYPKAILLESSDYHGNENAYSFICFVPVASFTVNNGEVVKELPGKQKEIFTLSKERSLDNELDAFFKTFNVETDKIELPANGLFGYVNFDAIQHFENIKFTADKKEEYQVPEVKYCFYKYVVAIDHHKNIIHIVENLLESETSQMDYIHHLLINLNFSTGKFETVEN